MSEFDKIFTNGLSLPEVIKHLAKFVAEHSWYFRNALVRANYNNITKGIYETTEYLELFLQNLLLDKKNELHNREIARMWNYPAGVSREEAAEILKGMQDNFKKK